MATRPRAALRSLPLVCAALLGGAPGDAFAADDPIREEISRLSEFLAKCPSTHRIFLDVKGGAEPTLARAATALADGRRLLALQRLEAARQNVAAARFLVATLEREKGKADEALFEAEWQRAGADVAASSELPDFSSVRPAAVRALGEAAAHRTPIYHRTAIDYGRATDPEVGLFYVGTTRAQHEFAEFCRTLPAPATPPLDPPPLRDIAAEIDALEAEILAAYRPPAAIARHGEFITASAYVKEARELNAKGFRRAALLEYLHAAMRFSPLRPGGLSTAKAADLALALKDAGARFAAAETDQSLGTLFVETGEADLAAAAAAPGTAPLLAAAIVSDVLPRYAAALEPGAPPSKRAEPEVTVTLVRWPFT